MAKTPVTPVPAATILLVRDGADGIEIFMVVRHHEIDFAAGAFVFPGGKTAPGDSAPELRARCHGAEGLDDFALELRVAGIREAFEECGVLFARSEGEEQLIRGDRLPALEHYRAPLERGEISIGELCAAERLTLACDQLVPFAHWVTPGMMPKRFDTHFFLAAAPADHVLAHTGHENVDSVWITPAQALAEDAAGKRTVIFPTRMNLLKLARSRTVAEALARAASAQIVRVEPRIEDRDGVPFLCIPAEADYDLTETRMDGIKRA